MSKCLSVCVWRERQRREGEEGERKREREREREREKKEGQIDRWRDDGGGERIIERW